MFTVQYNIQIYTNSKENDDKCQPGDMASIPAAKMLAPLRTAIPHGTSTTTSRPT